MTSTSNINIDMDVCGYVHAERKANSPLEDIYSEQIANSQEAIRLAKKINPDIECKIELINYIENNTLVCVKVRDSASGFTGIQNMHSKEMFKLFHHSSIEKQGFSEYGIGGQLKNMLLSKRITYLTKTNRGTCEKIIWDVDKSIEKNSIVDAVEYSTDDVEFPLEDGYYTGTELICENITEPYSTHEIAESILDMSYNNDSYISIIPTEYICKQDGLYKRLCKKYIKMDDTYPIFFTVYKDGEWFASKQIIPCSDLANHVEKTTLHMYESMATKKIRVIYERDGNWYESEPAKGRDIFRKEASILKPDKIASIHSNYIFRSKIVLYCSTDDRNINSKMGYDTYRIVEGGFIIKTNPEKLHLKWSKWSSHRTRYASFRGAIEYDRDSDTFLNSDKTKMTSDDRPFHDSIRWNILYITDKYFAKMKTENGFYDTEPVKKRTPKPILSITEPTTVASMHKSLLADNIKLCDYSQRSREELIEQLCSLNGQPGNVLLTQTFNALAKQNSDIISAIERIRTLSINNVSGVSSISSV